MKCGSGVEWKASQKQVLYFVFKGQEEVATMVLGVADLPYLGDTQHHMAAGATVGERLNVSQLMVSTMGHE